MEHFTGERGPHLLMGLKTYDTVARETYPRRLAGFTSASEQVDSRGEPFFPMNFASIRFSGDVEGEITYLEVAIQNPGQDVSDLISRYWDQRRYILTDFALCYLSRPDDVFSEHRNLRLAQKPVWDRQQIRLAFAPKNLYGKTFTITRLSPQVAPNLY